MKPAFVLGTTLAAAACAALIALPLRAAAQNAAQNKPAPAPKQEAPKGEAPKTEAPAEPKAEAVDADVAITARYQRASVAGDEHKWLATLAGKWKTSSKMAIKPNSTLVEATGTSEFKMFMDGRYLIENNSSGGAQGNSQGMGIIGFNNVTHKYERVWFDSHSTAMVRSEGEFQKDRDEIRWADQWSDPVQGVVTATKSSLRRLDDKHMVFTRLITLPNKTEFPCLVVQYLKAE